MFRESLCWRLCPSPNLSPRAGRGAGWALMRSPIVTSPPVASKLLDRREPLLGRRAIHALDRSDQRGADGAYACIVEDVALQIAEAMRKEEVSIDESGHRHRHDHAR